MSDTNSTFQSIGQALKRAREGRELSKEQIAERLRLSVNQVEAIESGCEDAFGAHIYSRGYVINYARQVGVNPQKLLLEWDQPAMQAPLQAATAHQPNHRVAEGIARWSSYLVGTAVVLLPIWWWASEGTLDALLGETGMDPSPPGGEIATPAIEQSNDESGTDRVEQPVLAAMAPIPSLSRDEKAGPPQPIASRTDTSTALQAPIQRTQNALIADPLNPPMRTELELVLSGNSWVEIRDASGARLEYDLLQGGTTHRYSGEPPYQVLLGNAGNVSVSYNDAPFDFSAKVKGNLARFEVGISPEQG